jgi:hypothetical protein
MGLTSEQGLQPLCRDHAKAWLGDVAALAGAANILSVDYSAICGCERQLPSRCG